MKTLNFLVLALSLSLTAACGDKEKKKDHGFALNGSPRTVESLFNPQTGSIEAGGKTYTIQQIAPQSQQFVQQVGMQLMQSPYAYRPAYQANNVVKYRVKVTGYLSQGMGMGMYPQQYPQQQYPQNNYNQYILVITAPIVPYN